MSGARTAVVIRAEDGVFQPMLLQALNCRRASIYRLTGCILRRIGSGRDGPPLITLSEVNEEVFVFVNVALETANHKFLDALVQLALLQNSGVVSGILIDDKRRILTAGFDRSPNGEDHDNYAGQVLHPRMFDTTRQVTSIAPYFFAVSREKLLAVGGLGILSSRRMPNLLQSLLAASQKSGRQVWVTWEAIATLAGSLRELS